MRTGLVATLGLALVVAGCGETVGERAVSGAAIGAGAGAAGAAVTDRDPVDGAVLGGLIGAGVGVLTQPNDDGYRRSRRYDDRSYRYEDDDRDGDWDDDWRRRY